MPRRKLTPRSAGGPAWGVKQNNSKSNFNKLVTGCTCWRGSVRVCTCATCFAWLRLDRRLQAMRRALLVGG